MTGPERTDLRDEIADRDIIEQAQRQVLEATWIPGLILTETQRIALVGGVLERIKPLLCAVTQAIDADVQRRLDAAREQTAEEIAQAIENREVLEPPSDHEHSVNQGLELAADIARQHTKGDGDGQS